MIPCWESVRPVPRVTIDFGDGRTITRTLTGNTVMYVLKPDGTVVDAFPGVYTPDDFLREVRPALDLARAKDGDLQAWHRRQALQIVPSAAPISVSKAAVEAPMLARLDEPVVDPANPQGSVDALSARLVDVSKRPADVDDLKATLGIPPGQVLTPEELGLLAVRVDSANNVRYARPAVHMLLASYGAPPTPAACRDDIFKRILHVPIDDPDLGLTKAIVPGTP